MTENEIVRTSLELVLPWPPSVNSYWQPFAVPSRDAMIARLEGRRSHIACTMTLTERARTFRSDVACCVRKLLGAAPPSPFDTPVRVDITLRPPDRRSRDIDNSLKGLLDAITHAGIWKDDSLVDELTLRRGQVTKDGAALVLITAL